MPRAPRERRQAVRRTLGPDGIHFRQVGEIKGAPRGLRTLGENSDQWALKTVWGVGCKFELKGAPGGKES